MRGRRLRFRYRALEVLFILVFLSAPATAWLQQTITVVDESGTPLIGAIVRYDQWQETTDDDGELRLPRGLADSTKIQFSYLSYEDLTLRYADIKANNYRVKLVSSLQLLDQVVIVGRTNTGSFDLPYAVRRIDNDEIFSSQSQTTADALELNGAAYVQKSQMGGGSPVLRGFEANKILLVVDGVRMNNAIYRSGHLQNAITIDPAILNRIELIYGPGSLIYGSDALGGVIHFRTRSPLLTFDEDDPDNNAFNAFVRYNSANDERTVHVDHMYSNKQFGVLTSISFSDFSDLRAGANRLDAYPAFGRRDSFAIRIAGEDKIISNPSPDIQVGSAYSQMDVLQKWQVRMPGDFQLGVNMQYSASGDIPRYDLLTEKENGRFRYSEWHYGPQKRWLLSPRLSWDAESTMFDRAMLITSWQRIREERVSRLFDDPVREFQVEDLDVYGLTIDFRKKVPLNQELTYGIDMHYNDLDSRAFSRNIINDQPGRKILSRYPDGGSSMTTLGIYFQHTWKNQDSTINWINGLRASRQVVRVSYDSTDPVMWPAYFYEGIKNADNSVVVTTGVNMRRGPWLMKASSGTAFRAPNVDDLAKIRINNDEITIPNPDLRAENVWNSEVNLTYSAGTVTGGLSAFYTYIDNAIVRRDGTLPDGSSFFVGPQDTLQVTTNVNTAAGRIRGISASFTWNPIPGMELFSSISLQKGRARNNEGEDAPLGHIPPTFGLTRIDQSLGIVTWGINWRYNLWKNIEDFGGSVDNPDLATPDGTPAWHVLDVRGEVQIRDNWILTASLNNIFDLHYRPFASGISAPGRHVALSLKYTHP